MKNLLLFIGIFIVGGGIYTVLQQILPTIQKPADDTSTLQTIDSITSAGMPPTQTSMNIADDTTSATASIVYDAEILSDGPFTIFGEGGTKTQSTVRIMRSPEEVLLQFENWNLSYPTSSHIYFSDTKNANAYLDLGPAKLSDGVLIYGIPLDANLRTYKYILIFDTDSEETLYYADVQ